MKLFNFLIFIFFLLLAPLKANEDFNYVLKKNENGKKIIKKLFKFIEKNPSKFIEKNELKNDKYRAIADYIAGMTDRYAINLYKKLK